MPVEYIRNVSRSGFIQPDGKVMSGVFRKLDDNESGLSLIERDETLQSDDSLKQLREESRLPRSNDLPGLAFITDEQLEIVGFTVKPLRDEGCARPHLHRLTKLGTCACEPEVECDDKCGIPGRSTQNKMAGFATVNNEGRRTWVVVQGFGDL